MTHFPFTWSSLPRPGKAAKITITERQKDILQTCSRSVTAPSRLRPRAAILLLAFDGLRHEASAARVGLTHRPVGRGRRRWAQAWNHLLDIECCESRADWRRARDAVLRDEPRPGAPGKFTPAQGTQIRAVACEPPAKSGRPITHGTLQGLVDAVVTRGIVASSAPAQVSRSLREAALQPHKSRCWLDTTATDPQRFQEQGETVGDTSWAAPEPERTNGTHTVCVDEMTGLQARERNAPSQALIAGKCERIAFASTRPGALCRIGNFVVTTGELLRPTLGATRTEAAFARPIEQTVATDPDGTWVFVVDDLTIHGSESVVKRVAQACGIAAALGTTEVRGVLKSMASRQASLSDVSHRIRFVSLPQPSSWLNQIEVVFGVIMRKVIRRGSFPSVEDGRPKRLNLIADFNRVFAKPSRGTYTGRPLRKATA